MANGCVLLGRASYEIVEVDPFLRTHGPPQVILDSLEGIEKTIGVRRQWALDPLPFFRLGGKGPGDYRFRLARPATL